MAEPENRTEPEPACGYCQKPLRVQYWQIAKRRACAECRNVVEREVAASNSVARFFGALGFGALPALGGSIAWIALSKLTGYEIGFLAIAIGFFVGKAVRKGAGGFGGPRYQALAIFLTYSAIALANLPGAVTALGHSRPWPIAITLAFASPFLGRDRALGLVIIGVGLYEAWKFTRKVPLELRGPYPIEGESPELHASESSLG
jgi:hypothetical protein